MQIPIKGPYHQPLKYGLGFAWLLPVKQTNIVKLGGTVGMNVYKKFGALGPLLLGWRWYGRCVLLVWPS